MMRRFVVVVMLIGPSTASAFANDTRWEHCLSVQSQLRVSDVVTPWQSDPRFFEGRVQQGPMYFDDCLNPHDMPDRYDEPNYGQQAANLQGTMGANGAAYAESRAL